MAAEVEFRRFRTWDTKSQATAARSWWLIVRSLITRYYRTWYVYMVMVLALFGAVLGIFLLTLQAGESSLPRGVHPRLISQAPMSFIGIAMGLFAMLVTAPSIAEDVRFNAQLFYFSKPMRIADYMLGKNIFNFLGIALVGLLPILVLAITALSIGPGDADGIRQELARQGASPQEIENYIRDWRVSGVDTWADAFYVAGMPILAVISTSIGLVGITMAVSSFTRRAWHAAVGTVVIITGWSILGGVAGDAVRGTQWRLYMPAGWLDAVTFLPFSYRFQNAECHRPDPHPYCDYYFSTLADAQSTIWTSHLLLVGTGVVGLFITWLRLKRLEGAA